MPEVVILSLFLIGLLFFIGGYYFSYVFYQKKHQVKYSCLRMFPYEFNYPSAFKNNVYGNIAFIIGLLCTSSTFILNLVNGTQINVTNIVLVALSISLIGLICCLLFMPLQFLRIHMITSSLAMVFSMGIPALIIFLAINKLKIVVETSDKALAIASIIVSAILTITMLLFTFNPKATYKIYLEKKEENGEDKYIRPSFIPMAFNEWLSIFIYLLSPIGLVLLSFIK